MTNIHVYQWFNINTLEYYIGYTMGKVKNYICSSKYVKPRIQANPNEWHKEVLGYFETGAEARAFEEDCIRSMWGDKLLLNRTITGKEFSIEGLPRSNETKEKLRQANLGKKHSEETKRKISEISSKLVMPSDAKEKIRQKATGRKHTPETIEKLKLIAKNRPPRKHSEETKKKMSDSAKLYPRKPHTEEAKIKIGLAAKRMHELRRSK